MASAGIIVRERRDDDLPDCAALLWVVHLSDAYPSVWIDEAIGWLDLPDLCGGWVAELHGELVGHLLLADVHRPDILPGEGALEVKRLFVAPSRRGLGIASSLLRKALSSAGRRPVVLEVVKDTEAVAVYQRLGWREITRRRADWLNRAGEFPELIWYQAPTLDQGR